MNLPLLIANALALLAFVAHTFMGDKELRVNEPPVDIEDNFLRREKWTMARCGWHWVSVDLLLASIGLGLINFTDFFAHEQTLLHILSVYFLTYGLVWTVTLAVSKQFQNNYLRLGQWVLLFLLSGLIYYGSN